ncbi:MAG: hypothetical protein LC775_04275, partial [Acidobacteria bacterium]|nr:hypothetical protein [Acidobacteriota bacterium]
MSAKIPAKKQIAIISLLLVFLLTASLGWAQGIAGTSGSLSQAEIDRIIKAFTAKEGQFRQALNKYSFKRDAVLQS